jgi:hypothetical protein
MNRGISSKSVNSQNNLIKKAINENDDKSKNKKEKKENAIKSENKNIRKASKLYSINLRNKINKKMKKINQNSRYKRNIYTLLYDQIKSDVAGIDKELAVAKKLIMPYHLLQRSRMRKEIFLNKNINLINAKDIEEEEDNNNLSIKKSDSKKSIPKIKNYNITSNILNFNNNTTNSARNDYMSKSLFSKLKSNSYTPFLKTRSKTKINIIKSISDNINKDSFSSNNSRDDKDEKYKKKNLPLITSDNFYEKKYYNTDRDYMKYNTFTRMNTYDLFNSKSSFIKMGLDKNQSHKRKKSLFVSFDKRWYIKNQFIYIKIDKLLIENNYIQSQIIHDQYALINENVKIIVSKYIVDKELINKFNISTLSNQQNININLEESIGLMIEISYLLLEKYENSLQNFITQIIKREKKEKFKIIDDEKKEFGINITLFTEASSFFTVCYKSYLILIQKDENYKIKKTSFYKLHQYFDRLRLGVNKVVLDMKNLYCWNNGQEKKLITECVQKIMRIKEQKSVIQRKKKLDCHRKFGAFRSGIDPFKYKGGIKLILSEDKEIITRINKALGKKNDKAQNFYSVKKFDIGSKLVTDLMSYGTKEFREFVISERIRRKFYESENNEEEDDD